MVVTNQNDSFYAGNKRTLRFTIKDQDAVGSPAKDITGMSVRWALCKINSAGNVVKTPLLEFNTDNPAKVVVTDAPNGKVEVYLSHDDTASLLGDYYHEAEIYITGSFSLVVATGTLTINLNVGTTT